MGLALARTDTTVSLTNRPSQLDATEVIAAERHHASRSQLALGDIKVLHAAVHGATEKALRSTADGHMRTGRLINAGLLRRPAKQNQPMIVDNDVLDALHPRPLT